MLSKLKWMVLSLAIIGFSTACSNQSKHDDKHEQHADHDGHDHDAKSDQDAGHEEHHANTEETLHLNNGKKWIVNDATEVGMKNMQAILINFAEKKSTDFAKLGEALGKETETLINKCDMTGPDHDQLHIVLHPMLSAIGGIKKGNTADVLKLSNLLGDYFKHFTTAKK